MSKQQYKIGTWKVVCDNCGKAYKRDECRKTWDGFLMCLPRKCWYPKHPNDNPRKIVNDGLPVADARPRPEQANNSYIEAGGLSRWEDSGRRWDTPYWLWRDDPWNQDPIIG
jgi:hypothetical protein